MANTYSYVSLASCPIKRQLGLKKLICVCTLFCMLLTTHLKLWAHFCRENAWLPSLCFLFQSLAPFIIYIFQSDSPSVNVLWDCPVFGTASGMDGTFRCHRKEGRGLWVQVVSTLKDQSWGNSSADLRVQRREGHLTHHLDPPGTQEGNLPTHPTSRQSRGRRVGCGHPRGLW